MHHQDDAQNFKNPLALDKGLDIPNYYALTHAQLEDLCNSAKKKLTTEIEALEAAYKIAHGNRPKTPDEEKTRHKELQEKETKFKEDEKALKLLDSPTTKKLPKAPDLQQKITAAKAKLTEDKETIDADKLALSSDDERAKMEQDIQSKQKLKEALECKRTSAEIAKILEEIAGLAEKEIDAELKDWRKLARTEKGWPGKVPDMPDLTQTPTTATGRIQEETLWPNDLDEMKWQIAKNPHVPGPPVLSEAAINHILNTNFKIESLAEESRIHWLHKVLKVEDEERCKTDKGKLSQQAFDRNKFVLNRVMQLSHEQAAELADELADEGDQSRYAQRSLDQRSLRDIHKHDRAMAEEAVQLTIAEDHNKAAQEQLNNVLDQWADLRQMPPEILTEAFQTAMHQQSGLQKKHTDENTKIENILRAVKEAKQKTAPDSEYSWTVSLVLPPKSLEELLGDDAEHLLSSMSEEAEKTTLGWKRVMTVNDVKNDVWYILLITKRAVGQPETSWLVFHRWSQFQQLFKKYIENEDEYNELIEYFHKGDNKQKPIPLSLIRDMLKDNIAPINTSKVLNDDDDNNLNWIQKVGKVVKKAKDTTTRNVKRVIKKRDPLLEQIRQEWIVAFCCALTEMTKLPGTDGKEGRGNGAPEFLQPLGKYPGVINLSYFLSMPQDQNEEEASKKESAEDWTPGLFIHENACKKVYNPLLSKALNAKEQEDHPHMAEGIETCQLYYKAATSLVTANADRNQWVKGLPGEVKAPNEVDADEKDEQQENIAIVKGYRNRVQSSIEQIYKGRKRLRNRLAR